MTSAGDGEARAPHADVEVVTDGGAPVAGLAETEPDDYDRMLAIIDDAIEEAHGKVVSGRVYDPENEKVRIKWLKGLGYLLNIRRQIQKDADLEEIDERVEKIEERENGRGRV